ncbi:MAG: hypothetical protein JXA00_01220 [Candidatus Thermoplasmatota archaeon]|nr:hypothetical protein [Candidatus Thermoplasmatota archaeon]
MRTMVRLSAVCAALLLVCVVLLPQSTVAVDDKTEYCNGRDDDCDGTSPVGLSFGIIPPDGVEDEADVDID